MKVGDLVRYKFGRNSDFKSSNLYKHKDIYNILVNRKGIVLSFQDYDDMKLANGEKIFLFANIAWFGKEELFLEKEFIGKLEVLNETKI